MLESGQIIESKYRIVRLVGEGGMGSVYEGENILIKRRVAIKILHAHSVSPETVMRFEREAQAAGCIGSDHILEVLDLGTLANGDRFMVMEFLDGETLGARMSRGRMNPPEVAAVARQVLIGLRAAHHASIVHRDLKPDNIFVLREKAGRADFAKIIDFGISKFNALGGDMSMTRTGAVMGTPYYMSPEQAQGTQQIDGRSDLYSLGVIMYEALSGAVPFDGDTFNELMFKIVLSNPRPLAQVAPTLDPQLVTLVEKAMARDIKERFQSADEMIQALDDRFGSAGGGELRRTGASKAAQIPATVGGGPEGVPTGNTWAASHADIPKNSSAPALMIGAVVLLLIGGSAFAAYQKFGGKSAAKTGETPAVAALTSAVAAPTATAKPSEAPVVNPVTSVQAPVAASKSAESPTAEPAPKPTNALSVKPNKPAPAARPAAVATARPAAARPVAKPSSPRDFGY